MIRLAVAVVAALVASATLAAAAPPPRSATTSATAFLLRITISRPGRRLARRSRVADLAHGGRSVVPVPRGRLGRQRRSLARSCRSHLPARPPRRSRSPRRSSSPCSTARSSPGKITASVSAGASERSVGSESSASRSRGFAPSDVTSRVHRGTPRSRTGERSPFSPAVAALARRARPALRRPSPRFESS